MKARGYSADYMDVKCPYGYEYVPAFQKRDGIYVDAYCRKLPKKRFSFNDPETQELSKPWP